MPGATIMSVQLKGRYLTPRYLLNWGKVKVYEKMHPDMPWLTERANALLAEMLKPEHLGFEWGSGRSTIWFGKRIKHLISIEDSSVWYERVVRMIKEAGLYNIELKHLTGEKYYTAINDFPDGSFDFILVDGTWRGICAMSAINKVKPGGLLVLDNAHWFIPLKTRTPDAVKAPLAKEWDDFLDKVKDWHFIWTTNGLNDTCFWIRQEE